jgi:hypothetical protein
MYARDGSIKKKSGCRHESEAPRVAREAFGGLLSCARAATKHDILVMISRSLTRWMAMVILMESFVLEGEHRLGGECPENYAKSPRAGGGDEG